MNLRLAEISEMASPGQHAVPPPPAKDVAQAIEPVLAVRDAAVLQRAAAR